MKKKIYIGTAYYPEHWPEERWKTDIDLMHKAGINVVRLAELAWAFLEPEDGKFDFGWLDRFIELAYASGIETVLGTPTEITATWLNVKHPEVIAVNGEGHIHGGRGNHCYNSPALISFSERMIHKMAEHYKENPAVIGWQLDNEIRGTKCYCPVCSRLYREWLQEKYGSLEELNKQWGTCFWSQVFHSWDEIALPSESQYTISTSQILDHFRFASHSAVHFLKKQADIIKGIAPHQFVSHNSLGLCEWVNLYDMGRCLDDMGWDSYPYVDDDNYSTCMGHDLARAVKGKAYWVWEQKNGYVNYHTYNLAIDPGLVRLWTYQDLARGANGVVYYRWRSNRYGYEQNPNGILRHDGSPRGVYEEISKMNKELSGFAERLADTKVVAEVAIIYSYEQMWDEYSNKQYKNISYQNILLEYYKVILKMGITADLVEVVADLAQYKLVIAPGLALVNEKIVENLKKYSEGGGFLVLGVRSGIKTWAGAMIDQAWPGLFSEIAGVRVNEFEVLPAQQNNKVKYKGQEYSVGGWLDRLELVTACEEARYCEKFYAGDIAISRNKVGKGQVMYIGVMECGELLTELLADIANVCGLVNRNLPEGVFVTKRSGGTENFWFVINKNRFPVEFSMEVSGTDVLSGQYVFHNMKIPALDLLIISEDRRSRE